MFEQALFNNARPLPLLCHLTTPPLHLCGLTCSRGPYSSPRHPSATHAITTGLARVLQLAWALFVDAAAAQSFHHPTTATAVSLPPNDGSAAPSLASCEPLHPPPPAFLVVQRFGLHRSCNGACTTILVRVAAVPHPSASAEPQTAAPRLPRVLEPTLPPSITPAVVPSQTLYLVLASLLAPPLHTSDSACP